ncbi:MAG TPA: hypothetical protein VNZ45_03055 [Bacteroidia bacterium]|jgi:hypothetical protein|nr:hypothetical protein [Bacteroidia bacterium]
MTKAAGTEKELAALHKKLTKSMLAALDSSNTAISLLEEFPDLPSEVKDFLEDHAQANPALLQAVSKFLKDNDITCPQDESQELSSLAQRLKNKRSVGNVTHIDED